MSKKMSDKYNALPMDNTIYDWRELNLQSLDLILCAGRSKMSKRIKWFQELNGAPEEEAKITHVAGIFYATPLAAYTWLQESTTLNKWAGKKGVQLNEFSKWYDNYDGDIYVKQLEFERTEDKFYFDDREFWEGHQFDPYESGIAGNLELLLCAMRLERYVRKVWPGYEPLRTKNPHCTEIVSMRLMEHGLLWNATMEDAFEDRILLPSFNRLPPWLWWKEIDKWLNVPCKPLKKIKG